MMTPDFPSIPGVRFRLVPKFPGYAVSDNGRVWQCRTGRYWRQLSTTTLGTGPESVWMVRKGANFAVHVPTLIQQIFGGG
jgi:hypothetical protein